MTHLEFKERVREVYKSLSTTPQPPKSATSEAHRLDVAITEAAWKLEDVLSEDDSDAP
jgi:hypothetical protein